MLKFSECYFWEPGLKVFDIKFGETTVIRDMDPFALAGGKLMPGDIFLDLQVKRGTLYVNGDKVPTGISDDKIQLNFVKGKADNPKINAIMLVEGGPENTHAQSYERAQ